MGVHPSIHPSIQSTPSNPPPQSVRILLVSKGVGSMGLNLTGAQRVVIFDPSWTADDDLQAMDRAYRMGQTQGEG